MKIATLIIGTFNPVTNAHLKLGHIARKKDANSDIFFVPSKGSFIHNYKGYEDKDILSDEIRIKLLREAVEPYGYNVMLEELNGTLDGRTYNTVNYVKNDLNYDIVNIVVGSDKKDEIAFWYRGNDLIKIANFIVVERDPADISSTQVRNAFCEKDLDYIRFAVPKPVYEYYEELNEK